MYNVLIIEDEYAPRERLASMKFWNTSDFKLAAAAAHGEEGLALYQKLSPDIIITDIVMPQMDGLTMIEHIRKADSAIPVIILSCHESFSFAQRAMRLGVQNYLLKDFLTEPILLEALESCAAELKALSEQQPKHDSQHNNFTKNIDENAASDEEIQSLSYARKRPNTRAALDFYSCIITQDPEEQQKTAQRKLGPLFPKKTLFCTVLIHIDNYLKKRTHIHTALLEEDIQNSLKKTYPKSLTTYMDNGEYLCLMPERTNGFIDDDTSVNDKRKLPYQFIDLVEQIHKYLSSTKGISVTIAVSSPYSTLRSFHDSLDQVQSNIKYRMFLGKNRVISPEAAQELQDYAPEKLEKKLEAAQAALDLQHFTELKQLIREIYRKDLPGMMQYHYVAFANASLVSHLITYLERNHIDLETCLGTPYLPFDELEHFETVKEMEQWFQRMHSKIGETRNSELYPEAANPHIRKALDIIEREYFRDLHLETVASSLHMHKVYFSRLFKQETGNTFYQVLQEYRIEKSKLLLRRTNLKFFEIAEKTGFHSYDHFCVVFKKITGSTPSDFQQLS
ncbi:MAG: response regulator [Spirochaetales bacterium]|nr:response regulator [Spirochaetales bacterium]